MDRRTGSDALAAQDLGTLLRAAGHAPLEIVSAGCLDDSTRFRLEALADVLADLAAGHVGADGIGAELLDLIRRELGESEPEIGAAYLHGGVEALLENRNTHPALACLERMSDVTLARGINIPVRVRAAI